MESSKNRIRPFCAAMLLVMLLTALLAIPAAATDENGSITVVCKGKRNGQTAYLEGDEYALVQIARVQIVDGGVDYTVNQEYARFDCEWATLAASQLKKKAKDLEAAALELHQYTAVGLSDSDGCVRFRDLNPGLYLLIRTRVAEQNQDFACDPGLYSIPSQENGQMRYDLSVIPKFDWTDPDKPEKLPQSGQLNWPIPLLALSGLGLFFTGFDLYFCKRPEEEV